MAGFRWVTVQRMTRAAGRALRGTHLALARPLALASLLAAPLLALPALALPAHAQGTAPQPDAPLTAPPVVDPKPVETTPVSPAGRSVAPQEVTLAPVPVLTLAGNATWEEAYDRLVASVKQVNDELARLGLARAGDTFIVYTSSDDLSFEYEVQVPFSGTTTQKPGSGMKLGGSHAGKVLKFAHTGSFSDMDNTYEQIANYLDEKNVEQNDMYIEQYRTDIVTASPESLEIDILVPVP